MVKDGVVKDGRVVKAFAQRLPPRAIAAKAEGANFPCPPPAGKEGVDPELLNRQSTTPTPRC